MSVIIGCGGESGGDGISEEQGIVSVSALRLAAAQSALDGTGTLSEDNFNFLEQYAKSLDSGNDWFASASGAFQADTADTANTRVTILRNETHTARFVNEVTEEDSTGNLIEFTLEEGVEPAFVITIVDE